MLNSANARRLMEEQQHRIKERLREPPLVKLADKIAFTLGVVLIVATEWIALSKPRYFFYYYVAVFWPLVAVRFVLYTREKFQFFLIDFCYFVNLSITLQGIFAGSSTSWFRANFSNAFGPVTTGIIVWRNSLVFHSLDKLTSFFLHVFPGLYVHLVRWSFIPTSLSSSDLDSFTFSDLVLKPFLLYIIWQICYLLLTDLFFAPLLRRDPSLTTSVRYMVRNRSGFMKTLVTRFCTEMRLLGPDEELDPDSFKCKVIFVIVQGLYTLSTYCFAWVCYQNYVVSALYLAIMYTWGTWNGASFYIEVFAARYNLQFERSR